MKVNKVLSVNTSEDVLVKSYQLKQLTLEYMKPLTPRVKPWVIKSLLTFDTVDKTLKCDHSLESC